MFIKKLRLKNGYKRFNDLTIDLGDTPARIIALVGPNGCGKSSVFDGLLYHSKSFGDQTGNNKHRNPSYHSMNETNQVSYSDIEILFTSGDFQKVRQSKGQQGKINTIFSFRSVLSQ